MSWYLLADSVLAFAIIISRLSDIFGRQIVEIGAFVMFMGFSLACGIAQNMIQLWVSLYYNMHFTTDSIAESSSVLYKVLEAVGCTR